MKTLRHALCAVNKSSQQKDDKSMIHHSSISKRASGLKASMTLEISALAQELRKSGKNICSLSAGEPDFDTPDFIVEATKKALEDGITRYGPAAGDPLLRGAIANKLTTINKVHSTKENILITNGGKQAIFNLFQILLDPGDEVLIPSPYWLSYPEITRFAQGKPIFIETSPESGFTLDVDKIELAISPKTKLLILNSPCNPTGKVMKLKELQAIVELLRRHPNIYVVSDEIYEFLISEKEQHISIAQLAEDIKDRIFIVNGFAKAWAMTGWRVGYLHGNETTIKKAIALQSQSTSNVCSFAQKGALAAIQEKPTGIDYMISSYNKRRVMLIKGLKEIDKLLVYQQSGAFYAFPKLINEMPDSLSFCKTALEQEGLAMIPGIAFGQDRCIRLSCSVSDETIIDGIERLKRLVDKLKK